MSLTADDISALRLSFCKNLMPTPFLNLIWKQEYMPGSKYIFPLEIVAFFVQGSIFPAKCFPGCNVILLVDSHVL